MKKRVLPFASYNLWFLFASPVGKEEWHCDMKRGFTKARQNEPQVKALLKQDNTHQRIGILAQKGVYEFHQDSRLLQQSNGVQRVADILQLNQESEEVQQRVISILSNYYNNAILGGKNIIQLNRGDEGFPKPITIKQGSSCFDLYAPTDCIFTELDGTMHILDFKTGKSNFDRRQAYVYLLAASYLYPQQPAVASFYNLENCSASEIITANPEKLNFVQIELAELAKKHELEKISYGTRPEDFANIFPANPGISCRYCTFNSICEFSLSEVYK
ncbi:PD-(D/E)XK nuclease family protein [Iningainema tapete]|uniref:PD-(D/E)XK nuclease family protein n=1 Tax=Iningainema tapete BLCC-T55 TaxID=2748662 RepID=A0A8J6XST3_9CYAN|nr:PD-(D/E)XK nuclease family protein [Iningainema tapete]MBD2775882.1 PD-(D/E)XK nuclease family protein [Iningainema tapete BLCC-T55]